MAQYKEHTTKAGKKKYIAYIRIKDEYSDILSKWSVPSARANILTALEKKNQIMPRRQLDYLKECFNSIEAGTIKNERHHSFIFYYLNHLFSSEL